MNDSPYRGPQGKPRDKRERERDRQARPAPAGAEARRPSGLGNPRDHARDEADAALLRGEATTPGPPRELRLHGLNACLAMFEHRPQDLRKVWLLEHERRYWPSESSFGQPATQRRRSPSGPEPLRLDF